jgi:hypothetical protein
VDCGKPVRLPWDKLAPGAVGYETGARLSLGSWVGEWKYACLLPSGHDGVCCSIRAIFPDLFALSRAFEED